MGVEFVCDRCGTRFQSQAIHIGGTATVNMSGNRVSCPVRGCGGIGHHKPGIYEFVNGVVVAFTAPGMTRQKVEAFRDLTKKAAQDEMSTEAAANEADKITPGLGDVLRTAHGRGITFDRILAVVLAFLAFWSEFAPDAELQALLEESQKQNELSQKMLEELQRQNATDGIATPKAAKPQAPQARMSPTTNRHERRKAKSLERRTAKAQSRSAPKDDGGTRK